MKKTIAAAAIELLTVKQVKKLTVKDIVETCHITRQAFYYHFEDIPALFQWILEKSTETFLQQDDPDADPEEKLRRFFLMAINVAPYIKKGMESNYRQELECLLVNDLYRLFEESIDQQNLFQGYSRQETAFIIRYHAQAITGIFREWSDRDSDNLDQIVHLVYLMFTGGICI